MDSSYLSVPTEQPASFYKQYFATVVIPDLLSQTANREKRDFYRRYYTGVVLPELLDHPILLNPDPPSIDPPGIDPPCTDPPGTDPPGTDPPGTDLPSTDVPSTDSSDTDSSQGTTGYNWKDLADMWDVDHESFWESHSPRSP